MESVVTPSRLAAVLLFAATSSAYSQQSLPTWPQQFAIRGPENASYGFVVTQPGRIAVEIQAQGAPVIAVLRGPAPQPVQQQGTGVLRLSYDATPLDVQRGLSWIVSVRLAQPAPATQGGVANGVIGVQHPPVDQTQVQAAASASSARTRAAKPGMEAAIARNAAQLRMQIDASLQQQQAQLEQQRVQRHAVLMGRVQPMLENAQKGAAIGTRAVAPSTVDTRRSAAVIRQSPDRSAMIAQPTASSSQALGTAGNPGGIQNVVPNAVINSLSATQGQPGDPVMISGSAFGTARGEVHFVIGPGRDMAVPPAALVWTETQIFAIVPQVAGVQAFNGTMYVKRADKVVSNLLPFAFTPLMERRQIVVPADAIFEPFGGMSLHIQHSSVWRMNWDYFFGRKGNDRMYVNTRLRNGWKVTQPPLVFISSSDWTDGGAYLAESRVGSDSPYVDVRWWVNPSVLFASNSGTLQYAVSIPIEGPMGTTDGVVVQ